MADAEAHTMEEGDEPREGGSRWELERQGHSWSPTGTLILSSETHFCSDLPFRLLTLTAVR